MNLNIKVKYFLGLLILVVIPQIIGLFTVYVKLIDSQDKLENEQILDKYSSVKEVAALNSQSLEATLNTNTNWSDYRDAISNEDVAWIQENIDSIPSITQDVDFIVSTDLRGKVISYVGAPKELSKNLVSSGLIEALSDNKTAIGYLQTTKGLTLICLGKVYDNNGEGQPTGICIFGSLIDKAWIGKIKKAANVDVAIFTNKTKLSTTPLNWLLLENGFKQKVTNIQFTKHLETNTKHIGAYGPIKDINGRDLGLVYAEAHSTASLNMAQSLKIYIAILLFTIIFTLSLFAYYLYRVILKPIQRVASESNKITKGDLSGKIIEIETKDELGQLAKAFNNILLSLRQIITQLQTESNTVALHAEELSKGAESVVAGANETAVKVNETATNIENVNKNIREIANASTEADNLAQEGKESVKNISCQMQAIQDATDSSKKTINKLQESSTGITQMVQLINQIADQTNILALNATIEAARAGEHGRGFAIVADEVRKLAEQSAAATKEISTLVKHIRVDSENAVLSMKESDRQVEEGTKAVKYVEQVFAKIIDTLLGLTQEIQSVTLAVGQVSTAMQNVSAASEEQTVTIENVSSISSNLAHMAKKLDDIAKMFKLE